MSLVHLAALCSHLQNASRARLALTSVPLTNLHLAVAQQLHKAGFLSAVTVGGPEPPLDGSLGGGAHPPAPAARDTSPPWRDPARIDVRRYVAEGGLIAQEAPEEGASGRRPPDDLDMDAVFETLLEARASQNTHPSAEPPAPAPTDDAAPQEPPSERLRVRRMERLVKRSSANVAHVSAALAALPGAEAARPAHALAALPWHVRQATARSAVPANPARRRVWLGLKYWAGAPVLGALRMESKPTRRIWLDAKQVAALTRGAPSGYVRGLRQIGECLFVSTDRGVMEARECVERKLGGMVLCRAV